MALDKLKELKKIVALQGLTEAQYQWLLDHVNYKEFNDGETVFVTGTPMDHLWLMSEGRIIFYLDVNGKLVKYYTFENDLETGGSGGLLPYSRMTVSPGSSFAEGHVKAFYLHKSLFPELEHVCPELVQRLVGYMTARARTFAILKMQQEKVGALGQLASGIAHELNNPASAINRISGELKHRLKLNYELTENMIGHEVNSQHIRSVFEMAEEKETAMNSKISASQRLSEEDEITDWLTENNIKANLLSVDVFVESDFTIDDFERIKNSTGDKEFERILQWLENLLVSKQLIRDLDYASNRISQLVGAVKSHVHMDRTNEKQATNVHDDIENTLTLLGYKLREKSITVEKRFCSNMRKVPAFVGELNQVWTNLIDNAIFAMSSKGTLQIETICSDKDVTVHIIDSGSGIPEDIVSRIFDPFFSTKKVGEGTGIGLNLVSRIIKSHDGEIKVSSKPGRTKFTVRLPFGESAGA